MHELSVTGVLSDCKDALCTALFRHCAVGAVFAMTLLEEVTSHCADLAAMFV